MAFIKKPAFDSVSKDAVVAADHAVATLKGLRPQGISKQPVERRRGLLARALRGSKTPDPALPTPQDS